MNLSCFGVLLIVVSILLFVSGTTKADIPEYPIDLLQPYTEQEIKWLQDPNSQNDIPELGDVTLPQAANDLLAAATSSNKNIKKSGSNGDTAGDMYQDKQSPSLLVMFYAPWCNHCKAQKPIFRNASAAVSLSSLSPANIGVRKTKDGSRVAPPFSRRGSSFALIDATVHTLAARAFSVRSYPTFSYFMPVLSWNEKGDAVPRMVGLPYGSGRDAASFEFAARYLDLGLRRGFVAAAQNMVDIVTLKQVEPPRVLFIVGPAANTTSLWKNVAPPAFVAASLTNGKAHFASYASIEQTVTSKNDIKLPAELKQKNASPDQKELFINMVLAYNKVSKGPDGEYVICLTDIDQNNGALAYQGSWPEQSLSDKIKQQQPQKDSSASSEEQENTGDEKPLTTEDDDVIERLASEAGMKNLNIQHITSSGPVRWIQQRSFLPIEQISATTFQQLAQEGRYVGLAVTKGTIFGRTAEEIKQETSRATQSLLSYLQRRRSRIQHQLATAAAAASAVASDEESNNNNAEEEEPQEQQKKKSSSKKKQKKTGSSIRDIIEDSTALPFTPASSGLDGTSSFHKLFLGTIDGGIFAEFLSDLKITEVPTFIIYDTEESSVFYDPEIVNALADIDTAWNSKQATNKDDGATQNQQIVDAIEVFVQRSEAGEVVDKPINFLGRVARFLTDYVPGLYRLKTYFGWDATQFVAIVGGVCFSLIVMLLAGRPMEDDNNNNGGNENLTRENIRNLKIDESKLSPEERKAYQEYKRKVLAARKEKDRRQKQQQQQETKEEKEGEEETKKEK